MARRSVGLRRAKAGAECAMRASIGQNLGRLGVCVARASSSHPTSRVPRVEIKGPEISQPHHGEFREISRAARAVQLSQQNLRNSDPGLDAAATRLPRLHSRRSTGGASAEVCLFPRKFPEVDTDRSMLISNRISRIFGLSQGVLRHVASSRGARELRGQLLAYLRRHRIAPNSYSPFEGKGTRGLLREPRLLAIAAAHNVTASLS